MDEEGDNDLTSLTWLLSSNVMPNVASSSEVSGLPASVNFSNCSSGKAVHNSNNPSLNKPGSSAASATKASSSSLNKKSSGNPINSLNASVTNKKKLLVHQKTNAHKLAEYHNRMLKEIDYKDDANAKPPYSYAALICLSMKDTKKKMTLSQIYKWIRENFAYYRKADKSWQNSIRHNLSLNKCFKKITRTKDEPGKGGFWTLDPQFLKEPSESDEELSNDQNDMTKADNQGKAMSKKAVSTSPSCMSDEKKKKESLSLNATKICLKFQIESSQAKNSGSNTLTNSRRPMTLKSPLMPTSCSTSMGSSDKVVNLTYSLPTDNSNIILTKNSQKIPINLSSLNPLPPNTLRTINYEVIHPTQLFTIPTNSQEFIIGPANWQSRASPNSIQCNSTAELSAPTPPGPVFTEYSMSANQGTMEEDMYCDDGMSSNLDMPLYSPLPHLQFTGNSSHFSNSSPLEDWIKQPHNLTLSSDALMASLNGAETVSSGPATPTSLFSDQTLPSFLSQSLAHVGGSDGMYATGNGFALPPLENTLDFDNVDLEELPP